MNPTELLRHATQTLIDHVEELTALDQAIGDGDHGLNMRRGALAIQAKLAEWEGKSLNEQLRAAGMVCMATVGGSSGPVFGTLLVTLSKELPEAPLAADLSRALAAGIAALTRLGRAEVGQKTLLDVLDPVRAALAEGADAARVRVVADAACAATADMQAIKGRSSFLGDRALGHVDPGSRSVALIVAALCETIGAAA
jgi:phosphoenolpyruvate---glycerone phosphotransferase subunit DhaL